MGPRLALPTHQGHLKSLDLWNLKDILQAFTHKSPEGPWLSTWADFKTAKMQVKCPHPTANSTPRENR